MTSLPQPTQACVGCGSCSRPWGDAVCTQCGTPFEHPQRRVVSVLFADLAGYTALCQYRDPEEVHLLVRPLMNALRRVCEDFGGMVPSIEGDGFMAAFGAVAAREDDPVRALSAAVQMQRLVRSRREVLAELPGLHVGLHVGEVVVAPTWEQAPASLSGDVVNVASRLCGQAGVGEVLASQALVELSGVQAGWLAARHLLLRGRTDAVAARTFAWDEVEEVAQSPRWFTGCRYVRRPAVESRLVPLLEARTGLLLLGAAGSGKSRLVSELLPAAARVQASCAPPQRSQLRDVLGVLVSQLDGDHSGLVSRLRHGGGDPEEGEDALLVAAVDALASSGLAVVVEDAERLSREDLDRLSRLLADDGAGWVVESREELPQLGLPVVPVPPLTSPEADALLEALLPGSSPQLRHAVLARAGDSPLYLEQCARLLLENGAVVREEGRSRLVDAERLREVPTSMRLFVSSRLDLLGREERELLGLASILGDDPDLGLLSFLVGGDLSGLQGLVDRGLLTWTAGAGRPATLRFGHALVRDVAYETQLRTRRAAIHRAASEWYAALPAAQVLEVQAYHLEAAVALGAADCDLVQQAVQTMVLYARSIEQERTPVARATLARARALVESRPECAPDTLALELGWAVVCQLGGDEELALTALAEALRSSAEQGDWSAAAEAQLLLGTVLSARDQAAARAALDAAEAAFAELGDLAGQARVGMQRGLLVDRYEGVVPYLRQTERAYHLAVRAADTRLQATAAQQLAVHQAVVGGRAAFEEWAERARAVSRPDDEGLLARLDLAEAILGMFGLDPLGGLALAASARQVGRECGLEHVHVNALVVELDLLVLGGDLAQAEAHLQQGRRVADRRPTAWLHLQLDLLEARLRQRQGDPFRASQLLAGVAEHELAASAVLRRDLAEARAWVALESGHFAQAEELAVQAVLLDEDSGEACPPLRARLIDVVAACAAGRPLALAEIGALRRAARETGLTVIAELASRWLLVDELTHGWQVDVYGLGPVEVVEARALDREIAALQTRHWDGLLEAAATWATLGTTVWQARALLWHAELTGTEHPEADALLERLQAPPGLAEAFRAQVRELRG